MRPADFLRARGCKRIAVASAQRVNPKQWGADGALGPNETGPYDGVVIADSFPQFMRWLEPMQRAGAIVIPAKPDDATPAAVRNATQMETAWNFTPAANYVARCGVKGHYLEFGVFWGNSFFRNHFLLRPWLDGKFFAFDSFAGLSPPHADETAFTAGDFQEGAYACSVASFEAIGAWVEADMSRVRAVPGFYDQTLRGHAAQEYGIEPGSVGVCIIDCDLYEPTVDVLRFVTPLLSEGALLYFDDWRLCRASSKVGERAAALQWLRDNPDIELIDFPGDAPVQMHSWQHQWFIYQRR